MQKLYIYIAESWYLRRTRPRQNLLEKIGKVGSLDSLSHIACMRACVCACVCVYDDDDDDDAIIIGISALVAVKAE